MPNIIVSLTPKFRKMLGKKGKRRWNPKLQKALAGAMGISPSGIEVNWRELDKGDGNPNDATVVVDMTSPHPTATERKLGAPIRAALKATLREHGFPKGNHGVQTLISAGGYETLVIQ